MSEVSEENVAIIREGFAAYQRGDLEGMLAPFSDDVVTHRVPPQPVGTWHGPEGFMHALADWTEAFAEWTLTLGDPVTPDDTHVIAPTHQRAVGAASGVPTEADIWMLFELDGGLITRVEFHSTERSALDAAAGRPPGAQGGG